MLGYLSLCIEHRTNIKHTLLYNAVTELRKQETTIFISAFPSNITVFTMWNTIYSLECFQFCIQSNYRNTIIIILIDIRAQNRMTHWLDDLRVFFGQPRKIYIFHSRKTIFQITFLFSNPVITNATIHSISQYQRKKKPNQTEI